MYNLIEQNFITDKPNQVWTSDMTYTLTKQGWQYLATVMDLYSRRIIGWSTDPYEDSFSQGCLKHGDFAKKIKRSNDHTSDRGVQYVSLSYQELLAKHKIQCSMSGKGNCYDNAPMESFYHTLKE